MVITVHKLPVGSFTFLQCLSGTELLNLSGTPYFLFVDRHRDWLYHFRHVMAAEFHIHHSVGLDEIQDFGRQNGWGTSPVIYQIARDHRGSWPL
jgi:hypothetical protein